MKPHVWLLVLAPLLVNPAARAAAPNDLQSALAAIRQVRGEGQGNIAAGPAWQRLARAEAPSIPVILAAMDDANELAANYLRSAVDAIADRELGANRPLPVTELKKFLADTRHHPRARRLAYELIARVAPAEAEKLVPAFRDDPSVELRYDAVQRLIDAAGQAQAGNDLPAATRQFREALGSARHQDQIKKIAGELRKLGQEVDLPRHFGFLTHWKTIGPFDNTKLAGFDMVFPPEQALNFAAEYDGKLGQVRWQDHFTAHEYSMLDLNQPLGALKGVTGYAFTEFNASAARPAELRLGCKNGWKIWFNGQLLFGRDEYHRGAQIDQYRLPVQLKSGRNTILVKLCQNEDVQDWTKEWEFQLRVCDATGTAILATDRPPTPKAKATPNADAKKGAKQ